MTTESPSKVCIPEEQGSIESAAFKDKAIPQDVSKSSTVHVPNRTSSAPPDEHGGDIHKSRNFQPTKTSQGMISSPADSARKHFDQGSEQKNRHDDSNTAEISVLSESTKQRNESSMGSPAGPKNQGGLMSNSPQQNGPNAHHQQSPNNNNHNESKGSFNSKPNATGFTGYNRQAPSFVPQNFVPYQQQQQQIPPGQGMPHHLQHLNSPQFNPMQMPPPEFMMQFQQYPQFAPMQPNPFGQPQQFPYMMQHQQFPQHNQFQQQPQQQQQQRFVRPQQQQFQQQQPQQRFQPVYLQPQMGFPLSNNMVGMQQFLPPPEHFQQQQQFQQQQRLPPPHQMGGNPPLQQRGNFPQHKPGHIDNKQQAANMGVGYQQHALAVDMNGVPIPDPNLVPVMGQQQFIPYHVQGQGPHHQQMPQYHPAHQPVMHMHPGDRNAPPVLSHIPLPHHQIAKTPYSQTGTPVYMGSPLVVPMGGENGHLTASGSKVAGASPAPFEPALLPPTDETVKENTDFSNLCDPCEPYYHHCQYTDSNNRLPVRKAASTLTYKKKDGEVLTLESFGAKGEATPAVVEDKTVIVDSPTVVEPIAVVQDAKTSSDSPFVSQQISNPLDALRISSPTLEDSQVEQSFLSPVQASLLTSNLNIPVTLASTSPPIPVSIDIPVVVVVHVEVPISVEAVVTVNTISDSAALKEKEQTLKKRSKKEILAAADLASGNKTFDMLSAYTAEAPLVETSKTPSPDLSLVTPSNVEDNTPDSWDDEVIPVMTASTPVQEQGRGRSLRPGGVKTSTVTLTKLNAGFVTKKYTKTELISIKPPAAEMKNPFGTMYETLSASEMKADKSPTPGGQGGRGGGQWDKRGDRDQQRGGEQRMRSNDSESSSQQNTGWKRDTHLNNNNGPNNMQGGASPAGNYKNNNNNKSRQPAPPKPKKLISDPMELLTSEVMGVLNKITPQSFDKLSEKMMTIGVSNTSMLDKLIELIFEKAVQEPNFTVVYADLCYHLTNKATNWLFYTIVKDLDSSDFFWIKDFAFESTAAGPFLSQKECLIAVLETEVYPELNPQITNLELVETLLTKNILLKVLFNPANKEYFVTFVPFTNIDEEMRSHAVFPDEEAARKDAQRKNNFRSRLVNSCQNEFQSSVQNESAYAQIDQQRQVLKGNKNTLSEQEYGMQEAQLEMEQNKLKRRMMGNIRFIGELYKQTLLQTGTMHSCIQELLGSPMTVWKELKDDQDIELLCRLLTTVGETLENKSQSSKDKNHYALFNAYFDRLSQVSRDKTLNSRMRFSIEEVVSLRSNNWQARRVQEGPAKLAEIAQRVDEDERRLLQQQQQQQQKPFGHHQQHQQQQQYRGNQHQQGQGQQGRGPPHQNQFHQQQHQQQYQQQSQQQQPPQQRVILARNNPNKNAPPSSHVRTNSADKDPSKRPSIPQVVQQQPQQSAPVVMLTESVAYKRMNGVINEYVRNNGDMPELCLRMSEAMPVDFVCLLLQVLQKYMDTSDAKLQTFLLALFIEPQINHMFLSLTSQIESALIQFEPFRLLVDSTLDCKMAPERLAVPVSSLIKTAVLSEQYVRKTVAEFVAFNVEDGNYDAAEIHSVFERFLVALVSSSSVA